MSGDRSIALKSRRMSRTRKRMSPGWDMEKGGCPGSTTWGTGACSELLRARAEGKENLLRASHQSCLEGEVGRETREAAFPCPNEETGRWSLESAIMFQILILTMISGDVVRHLLSTPERGTSSERAGTRCQGPFCTPPHKERSREVPTAARLSWDIGGHPGSQRAGYTVSHMPTPWPILVAGQLRA